MKANKILIVAAAMATSSAAFAQFSNGGGKATGTSVNNEAYNRISVSYAMGTLDIERNHNTLDLSGAAINFTHGLPLSSDIPLFLEIGGTLSWLQYSESEHGYKDEFTVIDASLPVNLTYKINISDEFSIVPFVGPNARFNIVATEKFSEGARSESFSLFDKNDLEYKDDLWNRFQIGGQVGIGFNFNKFYAGYQYQWNLTDLSKNMTLSRNSISVGINF